MEQVNKKINYLIYFNVILLIGLITIYILDFSKKDDSKSSNKKNTTGNLTIAFVNTDSLVENYELIKKMRKNLDNKKMQAENEFSQKYKKFQDEARDFQQKAASKSITADQAEKQEKKLREKEQQLYELNQSLSQQFANEELILQNAISDSIINLIHRFNKEKKCNYSYVLGYSTGSGILFADEKYDITKEVLEELNKSYLKK